MRKKRANKEKESSSLKAKSVIKIIKNIIYCIIVAFLLLSCTYLVSMKVKGKQPEVFGYKFYIVLTGSMEPDISPGDMVIVKDVKADSIEKGDVITFSDKEGKNITTHRVASISNESDLLFTTKGDANNVEDGDKVNESQILGKMTTNIKGIGKILEYVKKNIILFVAVIVFIFAMIFAVSTILKKIDRENDVKRKQNKANNIIKEK